MLSFYLSLSSSSVHLAIYVFYLFYLYCLSISQSIRLSIYLSMRSLSLLHSTHFYPVLSSYCVIQTTYLDIPFYSYLSLYPPVYIHIIMYILSVLFFLSLLDFLFFLILDSSTLFFSVRLSIHPPIHPSMTYPIPNALNGHGTNQFTSWFTDHHSNL